MTYVPPRPGLLAAIFLVALLGAVAGVGAWRALFPAPGLERISLVPDLPPPVASELLGTPRPDLTLPDLAGRIRSLDEWEGRVLLINFWATWCAPCREEMPMLAQLQHSLGPRGLQVLGIALDKPPAVRAFVAEFGVDYPVLIGEQAGMAAGRRYGNTLGGLPYTALVDREGRITHLKMGLLKRPELEPLILDLL